MHSRSTSTLDPISENAPRSRSGLLVALALLLLSALPGVAFADEPKAEAASAGGEAPKPASGKQRAEMVTSLGTIVIELDREKAPLTVANFEAYAKSGAYDGTIFHRVISNFMIQGGGYDKTLTKRPTNAPIENEADNGLKNVRGSVAMARTQKPHSATSQFFINVKANSSLNHRGKNPRGWGYAVFGQVVEGMDVVDAIKNVETGACGRVLKRDCPQTPVEIIEVKIVE